MTSVSVAFTSPISSPSLRKSRLLRLPVATVTKTNQKTMFKTPTFGGAGLTGNSKYRSRYSFNRGPPSSERLLTAALSGGGLFGQNKSFGTGTTGLGTTGLGGASGFAAGAGTGGLFGANTGTNVFQSPQQQQSQAGAGLFGQKTGTGKKRSFCIYYYYHYSVFIFFFL